MSFFFSIFTDKVNFVQQYVFFDLYLFKTVYLVNIVAV